MRESRAKYGARKGPPGAVRPGARACPPTPPATRRKVLFGEIEEHAG
jgi:hypothetical protein